MRISDWSSDVCSSDLGEGVDRLAGAVEREHDDAVLALLGLPVAEAQSVEPCNHGNGPLTCLGARYHPDDVRSASNRRLTRPFRAGMACGRRPPDPDAKNRQRGAQGTSRSLRVIRGGRGCLTQKKKQPN